MRIFIFAWSRLIDAWLLAVAGTISSNLYVCAGAFCQRIFGDKREGLVFSDRVSICCIMRVVLLLMVHFFYSSTCFFVPVVGINLVRHL